MKHLLCALVCLLGSLATVHAGPVALVACAPGYPGDTEQAQPTMDDLARSIEKGAGWTAGQITAVYYSELEGGIERMRQPDAGVALVPLPFYLQYREQLELRPLLQVVPIAGDAEVWSLVARRGAISDPASMAGWQLAGMAGYSPRFVRGVALTGWGQLPEDLDIQFNGRVLSVLRKAVRGESVAALLDTAQGEALGALPFADQLEVVARSQPLISTLVCAVGDRLSTEQERDLRSVLVKLHRGAAGTELLETLRLQRFEELSEEALASASAAFDGLPN